MLSPVHLQALLGGLLQLVDRLGESRAIGAAVVTAAAAGGISLGLVAESAVVPIVFLAAAFAALAQQALP